jgi:hypothetical protein
VAFCSKVIHPVAQGDKMGYLTACGSLSRMVGPMWATALYMSSLPNLQCTLPTNATLANYTLHNATWPCHTDDQPAVAVGPFALVSGDPSYHFGVRGYPGAWMFVVLAFLVRKKKEKVRVVFECVGGVFFFFFFSLDGFDCVVACGVLASACSPSSIKRLATVVQHSKRLGRKSSYQLSGNIFNHLHLQHALPSFSSLDGQVLLLRPSNDA